VTLLASTVGIESLRIADAVAMATTPSPATFMPPRYRIWCPSRAVSRLCADREQRVNSLTGTAATT